MSNGSPTFINTGGSSTLFDFVWGKGWNGLGNDYTFSFTVTAGFTVTFTSLSFFDATIFGPTAWSLSIDGFGFGSGSTHGGIGGTNSTVLPSLVFAAGTHNVKLHAAGANLSSGLWAVDDFKLSGIPGIAAPVPLPAAVWLMGSALLGLAGMGRRRACGQTPLS
ncbi:MAG: VPLPA-CTERM sorting domain-containing protein [Gammaproteobacteria bacterium]